ncbi:MAG: hypothetical protein EBX40_01480 [Gammaproteobacteria bacterium]|nr:hypothetical protein [Gammaproteobacteria bacterium]
MAIDKIKFVTRLSIVLDEAELPSAIDDRAQAFGKIFQINAIMAERILDGLTLPSPGLLQQIADEFEVNAAWLAGEGDDEIQHNS